MATKFWPSNLIVGAVDYSIEFDVQINVSRSGGIRTFGLPGARWAATLNFTPELESMRRPQLEALIVGLAGGANRLSMHHHGRPQPNGGLRGAPTVGNTVAAGLKTLPLSNCNAGLRRGDLIGVGGQLLMVVDQDVTPSAGNMTVSVEPAIRTPLTAGAAVTWDKPSILWIPRSPIAGPFPYAQAKLRPQFSIQLIEAY
jgi:hypothetical protein